MSQTTIPSSVLARETWQKFVDSYSSRLEQFRSELLSTWEQLSSELTNLQATFEKVAVDPERDRITSLRAFYTERAEIVLEQPVKSRLSVRPQHRALVAITDLNTGCEDILRSLPTSISISNQRLAEVLRPSIRSRFVAPWHGWGGKRGTLRLRQIVADLMQAEAVRRTALDGAFQLLLAQASLHLLGPWHILRQRSLEHLEEPDEGAAELGRQRDRWNRWTQKYHSRATSLLERYSKWCQEAPSRLSRELLGRPAVIPEARFEKNISHLQDHFSFWARQQRGIQSVLELELEVAEASRQAIAAAEESVRSVEEESFRLRAELTAVIKSLEKASAAGETASLPQPKSRLLSADLRIDRLGREVNLAAQRELPATVETIEPSRALPGLRKPWRQLEPAAIFERAVSGGGRRTALDGFREAEDAHRAIVREIERAREVTTFAAEVARDEGEEGKKIATEGVANAIELLRYQESTAPDIRPIVERALTRGLAGILLQCHIAVAQGRLGLFRHLVEETSERGARQLWVFTVNSARQSAVGGWGQMERLWTRLLYLTGWKAPPSPPAEAVFRTERFEDTLNLRLIRADLPLIYRRLFRLDPVEDSRFLIGRDAELAGLVEARRLWLDKKSISVLVIGARGSGKTSLLNCGERVAFNGLEVVRGYFQDRILTAEAMRQFLRDLLELPSGADLAEDLTTRQRVVIIEELERTFLRRMNGFEGIRCLLELITNTARTTLWVLSLNEQAARYLNLTVGLNRYFSHRINAMAVQPEDLRGAILMRHNLSGFRLSCAPPPEADPRVSRIRRRLGLERDAQDLFFESLYSMSEGIFRSAFELWQHQIERVEGGVVHLRQPAEASYSKLLRELSMDDCFTLSAIQQHGGLTRENLAEVFDETEDAGKARIERLLALELIEPDPRAPGYRIRPEAGRLVREALHGQNL